MNDYDKKVNEFVQLLTAEHQRISGPTAYAYLKSGRRYDRVFLSIDGSNYVRYFIDRADGAIYGVRSLVAPNLKHWFGDLDSTADWMWGDLHPTPKNPDKYIFIGRYGVYNRYAKKE